LAATLKQRLLAGGFWVLVGKGITATANVATQALLTRLLVRSEYGSYVIVLNLVTVAAMAAQAGLHQAVVRLIGEALGTSRPERARAAVARVFRYCAVGIAVVCGGLFLGGGAWLARHVYHEPLLLASMGGIVLWVAFLAYQVLSSETFRGLQDLRAATLYGGVITGTLTVAALLGFYVLRGTTTFSEVVTVSAVATGASMLLGLVALRRRVATLPGGGALPTRDVFSVSVPLWITSLTTFALTRFDVLILGAFIPNEQVALYGAAATLVSMVTTTLILVNLVVPPFIAELHARGEKQKLERVLRSMATLAGLPSFLVLAAFLFFGGPILGLVYPESYRDGASVLAILSVGRLVNVWTGSCGYTLAMTGHQRTQMWITVASSIAVVAASLLVVQRFGMLGVATVGSAGMAGQNVAMWLAARYHTGIWTHAAIPRARDVRALLTR